MTNKEVAKHTFDLSETGGGGESLILTTTMFDNGDGEIYYNQQLTLYSYCNSASINLCAAVLNPDKLRKLANELEKETIKAELLAKGK